MTNLFKQFDTYSLKARAFPALIAGLPPLALLFVLVPWDYLGLAHLMGSAIGFVLLFAFADVGRRAGRLVQTKLGTGSTPEQWHRGNADIAEVAKDRYRAFVAKQINLNPPTANMEKNHPGRANDFYRHAGDWLRDNTRDKRTFSILFGENVAYGYRRNLLGLKPTALGCDILVIAVCAAILRLRPAYFANLPQIDEKLAVVILVALLHLAYMLTAVSKAGVREASLVYGRQLILSCETLMREAQSTM